jgi:hypothetical protein
MKVELRTEPRKQRLKRKRRAWPQWLRSKHLIRWLFVLGPLVYRIYKVVSTVLKDDGG